MVLEATRFDFFYTSIFALLLVGFVALHSSCRRSPARSARSPTPDEKPTPNGTSPAYSDVYPPSARDGLLRLVAAGKTEHTFHATIDPAEFKKNLIPWDADWRACSDESFFPSGIRLGEVRKLGEFPDYAMLSGVPAPEAYKGFVLEKAVHRPYRPFRWGYHQTMGACLPLSPMTTCMGSPRLTPLALTKLEPNWWLELEHSYCTTMSTRLALWQQHGTLVLDYLPGVDFAAKEVMELALQFYATRYPQFFTLAHAAAGWTFHNRLLGTSTAVHAIHPLHVLVRHVPEDFALMVRHPDGQYYFRGGVICSALGWNVGTKLGRPLRAIHDPVPEYAAKMDVSMDRFFAKMPTHKPIQRGSWEFAVDRPLFLAPGDPQEAWRHAQLDGLTIDRVHLRVDWQTLRRLPLSGAIAFNFKAVFTPLEEFRTEPFVPALGTWFLGSTCDTLRYYCSLVRCDVAT